MKALKYISATFLLVVAFTVGVVWEKHRVIESGPFQLTSPLILSGDKVILANYLKAQ